MLNRNYFKKEEEKNMQGIFLVILFVFIFCFNYELFKAYSLFFHQKIFT